MIGKLMSVAGSALVGLVVHMTVIALTGSPFLAMFMTGICAFTLGIAAARDGLWRD